ncbi:hotdog fold thioesterase [Amphritea sp. HPY]|uniref:hotdog fold thioesterase n=1 Tax=Amphritea sp. HPY TaxID=3421652 RepID=UPI003D7D34AF
MSIWKTNMTVDQLQSFMKNTLVEHLGIEISEIGDDFIRATMPVDPRTHQPMGILHGGASVVLAESLGSMAAQMAAEPGYPCVGLEVNANHLSSIKTGSVTGTARPIHIGRSTQVWDIRIEDENAKPVCISRLTVSVLKP